MAIYTVAGIIGERGSPPSIPMQPIADRRIKGVAGPPLVEVWRICAESGEKVTMDWTLNHLNQPVGVAVPGWQPPDLPPRAAMEGRYCRVEPLDPARHAADLFDAYALDQAGRNWTYLAYGPFATPASYRAWADERSHSTDPLFYAIVDRATDHATGIASYLRIDPASGSIEIGHINYSPLLQRTPGATEAMALMMEQAFSLGYRRYEWKCDALNAPSRAAARRLGFSFEGVFRQATVVKGRNRDTAWYSVLDSEWPALQAAFSQWLAPENFDEQGRQRAPLSALRIQGNLGVR